MTPAVKPRTALINFEFSLLNIRPIKLPIVVERPAIELINNGVINCGSIF